MLKECKVTTFNYAKQTRLARPHQKHHLRNKNEETQECKDEAIHNKTQDKWIIYEPFSAGALSAREPKPMAPKRSILIITHTLLRLFSHLNKFIWFAFTSHFPCPFSNTNALIFLKLINFKLKRKHHHSTFDLYVLCVTIEA